MTTSRDLLHCWRCSNSKEANTQKKKDTNITLLALQNFCLMDTDSVNVQIYKIDIEKFIFVKKNIDFGRNIRKIILYL